MISGISGVSSYSVSQTSSSSNSKYSLNSSQLETISNVLSNYDASSLTSDDAKEIVSSFQEVGIRPSRELAEAMSVYGFDASQVGELAGAKPPPPPPPPKGDNSEQDSISSVLDILLNGEDDEDSEASTSFETILDYTSRILSLNDSAKDKVQELLENYSQDNTDLSRDDARKVVQNALGQILSDTNNYNTTSFYG